MLRVMFRLEDKGFSRVYWTFCNRENASISSYSFGAIEGPSDRGIFHVAAQKNSQTKEHITSGADSFDRKS
jgi:hypothetical protein